MFLCVDISTCSIIYCMKVVITVSVALIANYIISIILVYRTHETLIALFNPTCSAVMMSTLRRN